MAPVLDSCNVLGAFRFAFLFMNVSFTGFSGLAMEHLLPQKNFPARRQGLQTDPVQEDDGRTNPSLSSGSDVKHTYDEIKRICPLQELKAIILAFFKM